MPKILNIESVKQQPSSNSSISIVPVIRINTGPAPPKQRNVAMKNTAAGPIRQQQQKYQESHSKSLQKKQSSDSKYRLSDDDMNMVYSPSAPLFSFKCYKHWFHAIQSSFQTKMIQVLSTIQMVKKISYDSSWFIVLILIVYLFVKLILWTSPDEFVVSKYFHIRDQSTLFLNSRFELSSQRTREATAVTLRWMQHPSGNQHGCRRSPKSWTNMSSNPHKTQHSNFRPMSTHQKKNVNHF